MSERYPDASLDDVLLKVPDLIAPLCHNSQCILEERYDNQKAANGCQVRAQWLRVDICHVLDLAGDLANLRDRIPIMVLARARVTRDVGHV